MILPPGRWSFNEQFRVSFTIYHLANILQPSNRKPYVIRKKIEVQNQRSRTGQNVCRNQFHMKRTLPYVSQNYNEGKKGRKQKQGQKELSPSTLNTFVNNIPHVGKRTRSGSGVPVPPPKTSRSQRAEQSKAAALRERILFPLPQTMPSSRTPRL